MCRRLPSAPSHLLLQRLLNEGHPAILREPLSLLPGGNRRKIEIGANEAACGTLLDSGRGKLCSHHGPTWNSEALRLITILFLLRVHFTVRIDFPIQMSPQPSLSQRSNQTES